MAKIQLKDITLLGVDCVNIERLVVAAEICTKNIVFGEVKLLSHLSHKNSDIIKIPQIKSIEEYSRFMIKELYKYVNTDFVLVFQYDGFILNAQNWSSDFLQFDYIGANWSHFDDEYSVGNGGFSLRSRKLIKLLATDNRLVKFHPEDYIICRTYRDYLEGKGIKFAPREIADKFSVEDGKWVSQFGFHQTDFSDWNIHKFLDKKKYPAYFDMFFEVFPDSVHKINN